MNPADIDDESLRNKLNSYVQDMGFEAINDDRIIELLDIDMDLNSRDQIILLEEKLHKLLMEENRG